MDRNRLLRCMIAWSLMLGGCSSVTPKAPRSGVDADGGADDGAARSGPCSQPLPALATRRGACEFDKGALAKATIGTCVGKQIPIEHVIVIMQENRSFDHYFGHLKGHGQDDIDVPDATTSNPAPDAGAPIAWHHESAYCVADTDHGWAAGHRQWNNGKNDGFAITNATAGDPTGQRALGYYDHSDLPFYYDLAATFAISDRYFSSVLASTYPNRMFSVAGTSFGIVTTQLTSLAPKGVPTVYRALNDKHVSWKAYKTDLPSVFLFPDFANDPAQAAHIVTADQFLKDAAAGTLPQVAFVDAGFQESADVETDEHEPADIQLGQHYVWQRVTAVMHGPQWRSSAIFITYDEHGGLYDHVSPPSACAPDATPPAQNPELGGFDRLGFRVPVIVVSPYARRHYVSHTVHSHTSILRFVEAKFDLPALTKRDANSDAMLDLFDFSAAPRLDVPKLTEPPVDAAQLAACKKAFPK